MSGVSRQCCYASHKGLADIVRLSPRPPTQYETSLMCQQSAISARPHQVHGPTDETGNRREPVHDSPGIPGITAQSSGVALGKVVRVLLAALRAHQLVHRPAGALTLYTAVTNHEASLRSSATYFPGRGACCSERRIGIRRTRRRRARRPWRRRRGHRRKWSLSRSLVEWLQRGGTTRAPQEWQQQQAIQGVFAPPGSGLPDQISSSFLLAGQVRSSFSHSTAFLRHGQYGAGLPCQVCLTFMCARASPR